MRRLFEIDGADESGLITVGETPDSDRVVITLTLPDTPQSPTRVLLDQEAFKALCDLRYKIDFMATPSRDNLRAVQSG